ncbi:protein FAM227B-like [Physella acuta]|uniref:protein FAM227B-like n=1 Tax=Physella acuta TaxID=109671 RepID=UPI0027DE2BE7|nr:protein FAM227B-like [Physella acuta]XP_059176250.1 protein FAM227B-like [Physella acuta]
MDNMLKNREDSLDEIKPPFNYAEFLAAEGLNDWPFPMSLERPLDIQSEGMFMGSQEEITEILKASAPLGLYILDEMENRLDDLEDKLNVFASQILTDEKRTSLLTEKLFYSPSRTFITEGADIAAILSRKNSRAHKSTDLVESMLETRKKSLEYYRFPGFVDGELIELPAQLEAPPILHRVTKAQDFNSGFKKFWKKLFLSEASTAVLQDSFWWIFLDFFNKEEEFKEDKDCLFDRMADSFVALFTSINAEVKDKFLSEYPNCLAQGIYCTFREAFPESIWKFNNEFKQYLVDVVYEMVTGIHPVPGLWKTWNEDRLEQIKTTKASETAKMLEAAGLHRQVELSLDMDGFTKVIDRLGAETSAPQQGQITREVTKMSSPSKGSQTKKAESHQIGPGPKYERVKFNTSGRSPLIAHYLHMRKLKSFKQPGMKVRRTEILQLPPDGQTYEEFIAETLNKAVVLKEKYNKTCEQSEAEINELNKKQLALNRKINRAKRAFNNAKTMQERRALLDEMSSYLESDPKEIPLLDQKSARTDTASEGSDENV